MSSSRREERGGLAAHSSQQRFWFARFRECESKQDFLTPEALFRTIFPPPMLKTRGRGVYRGMELFFF